MSKSIILADCEEQELREFKKGLEAEVGEDFIYCCNVCNKHGGLNDIKRFLEYIFYPLRFVFKSNQCKYVIGWQQFFALFYCFWSRLFCVKKCNTVIVLNFTYKKKKGIIGPIYKAVMKYCLCSKYLDYIHVPSANYANICSNEFDIDCSKFIVTCFGIPDPIALYNDEQVEYDEYSFSIGRSNRDFEWLVSAWGEFKDKTLVIASDTWKPQNILPSNVVHRKDIKGKDQYKYISNARWIIIPIDNGAICSGDTVLLTAMAFRKTIFITAPSTLAEMYIDDGVDGVCIEKSSENLAVRIKYFESNVQEAKAIGNKARQKFLETYTRYQMGLDVGKAIKE